MHTILEMLEHISNELNVWGPTMRYWFSGIAAVLISDADDIQVNMQFKNVKMIRNENNLTRHYIAYNFITITLKFY